MKDIHQIRLEFVSKATSLLKKNLWNKDAIDYLVTEWKMDLDVADRLNSIAELYNANYLDYEQVKSILFDLAERRIME